MAVFILEDALSDWMNLGIYHLLCDSNGAQEKMVRQDR